MSPPTLSVTKTHHLLFLLLPRSHSDALKEVQWNSRPRGVPELESRDWGPEDQVRDVK